MLFHHWWFVRPAGSAMMVRAAEGLSERERRELDLIERHLAAEDPELAHTLRTAMGSPGLAWVVAAVLLGGVAVAGVVTGSFGLLVAAALAGGAAWWLRRVS
ncbi:DUF3040 domain-containing protein [Amycolatopsis sp. 195334CR]|uniref:DUF3040 domain-containing protein n=1 Tax=Amycolatopsis sp. 195334CR TaxID=2814588 RepID=UPI001A8D6FCC|nr:DUF3040 domain-containing protein [Amycolatopsis sp. 195334CR]MBN6038214.1 DUF3040 domain-containing protein [Amycolatopsis sp. 195334CR]